jgi:hypothetical protein
MTDTDTDTTDTDTTDLATHERNMRALATLAKRWNAGLRVELLPRGTWTVRAVTRRHETLAGGLADAFADAVAECLDALQRLTDEDDAREAEVAS